MSSTHTSGLDAGRLERIRSVMTGHIDAGRLAGAAGLMWRRGSIAYLESFGLADREASKPMREDAIFRIYSMTKPITGVAALMLFEEGAFTLTDPLHSFIPEFRMMQVAVEETDPVTNRTALTRTIPAGRPITILDLMRHTAGFNYAGPRDEDGDRIYRKAGLEAIGGDYDSAEFVRRLADAPLVNHPGTVWDYGFSTDVLGRVVEVVSGKPLDAFFMERILDPLGMTDTAFFVPESKWDRLAVLYVPTPDGQIERATIPAQESFRYNPAFHQGGAGLTSTISDYLKFTRMLYNGGALDGERLLSPKTVELMRSDLLGNLPVINPPGLEVMPPGYGFGVTVAVSRGPGPCPMLTSAGSYRWGGAAGTGFWIDPKEETIGIFMMQTLLDLAKRAQFQHLAYQAIVD